MGEIHDLAGEGHVLLEGKMRSVDHHRGKPALDTGPAQIERTAVIEVQGHRDGVPQRFRHGHRTGGQVRQHGRVGILPGTAGDLQDHGGFGCHTAGHDALQLLHVVEIVGRHRKAFVHGLAEHVARVHQSQILVINIVDHDSGSHLRKLS